MFRKSKHPDVFYNVRWSTWNSVDNRQLHVKSCIGNRVVRDQHGLTIFRANGTVSGSWPTDTPATAIQVDGTDSA